MEVAMQSQKLSDVPFQHSQLLFVLSLFVFLSLVVTTVSTWSGMGPKLPLFECAAFPYILLATAPHIAGAWWLQRKQLRAGTLERLIAAGSVWLFAPLYDLHIHNPDSLLPRSLVITIDALRAIPQAAMISLYRL